MVHVKAPSNLGNMRDKLEDFLPSTWATHRSKTSPFDTAYAIPTHIQPPSEDRDVIKTAVPLGFDLPPNERGSVKFIFLESTNILADGSTPSKSSWVPEERDYLFYVSTIYSLLLPTTHYFRQFHGLIIS